MFSCTESVTIPVSFTGNLEQTVSYVATSSGELGIWITWPSLAPGTFSTTGPGAEALSSAVASGKLSAMFSHQYSMERGFEPLAFEYDAFKVAELISYFIHEFEPATRLELV